MLHLFIIPDSEVDNAMLTVCLCVCACVKAMDGFQQYFLGPRHMELGQID